jgi:hypothetical protein
MRYLLGLATCLVLSGIAKSDVVTLFNTSTQTSDTSGTIGILFTAASGSSVSGFKVLNTSGSGQITASFVLDNGVGTKANVLSAAYDGSGYYFDLTTGWSGGSGNSNLNLSSGNYSLTISNLTGNYGVGSSSISTVSGSGLTSPSYVSGSGARFEIYSVPEPGTLLLGGIAAACGGTSVWWKRRKRQPQPETTEQPAAI